ncbi:uncharacterized protein LOC131253405 [Magnolia sinica]|uniref:uncharacterized protein LOC131253405 n=1 Tax=Magnolia sinica TaxID=86752 RepID=UPI002658AB96|nr:uncharacterized protein LOC131253405 [Magnolia sinica]
MATNDQLLVSLVSDIKSYTGKDPLLPWLQGIRKMKESLSPHILKEKLPRFLQRCAHTFESDRRYRNDLRYLRVWIQLMDFVDDPKVLLRRMEENQIGPKRAIFYQAYALYYEKLKKFEEAEKMYHSGVQNLAEPVGELQKSYEKFLHRMELYKKRKTKQQEGRAVRSAKSIPLSVRDTNIIENQHNVAKENPMKVMEKRPSLADEGRKNSTNHRSKTMEKSTSSYPPAQHQKNIGMELDKPTSFCGDDTVVVKFVGSAIVGKAEAEEACHHGLVDPTINMKEAMNAINSMFREPLEPEPNDRRRRSQRNQPDVNQPASSGFEVFVDESSDNGARLTDQKTNGRELPNAAKGASHFMSRTEVQKPHQEMLEIYCDDGSDESDSLACNKGPVLSVRPSNVCNDQYKLRDDTVVCRFVGSTVFGEPEVENACHHGLVDPTINMKEAMDDINSMFGKPLDFVRANRSKKQGTLSVKKQDSNTGFSIFTDDDLGQQQQQKKTTSYPSKVVGRECDLFEPTLFTKEAMDEINEMFGKPLDF